MARSEGIGLFGLRLTKLRKENKQRKRGELRTELAHILCLVSEPKRSDIVCDPFAGRGSLVIELASSFPYQKIYASDIENMLVQELRNKVKRFRGIDVAQVDALHLNLPNASVDKIITDPPWGEYQQILNLKLFYEKVFEKFDRILKPSGIITILIGAKEIFEETLEHKFNHVFSVKKKYNILVSGKKAAIYKITKRQ